ncbi:MAG: hypothetical protein ACKVG9_13830, partial [Rhodospirillales bacterium]
QDREGTCRKFAPARNPVSLNLLISAKVGRFRLRAGAAKYARRARLGQNARLTRTRRLMQT